MIRKTHRRTASVLICVLACLVVVTGLTMASVKSALVARRQVRQERNIAQTELLLQAGIQRAVTGATGDAAYEGEVWNIPAESLGVESPARVTITLNRDQDQSTTVTVVAQLPADSPTSVQRSHTFTLQNEE